MDNDGGGNFPDRATPYDEFRYPGKFYPHASCEHMAMLANLSGIEAARPECCRVLEIGCGEGGHLAPLAYAFPESSFVGVDLSQNSIERATELAGRLGLNNAKFIAQDLVDFPEDSGTFDYIIAHGIYSWVPEEAQEKILEICGRHLAPNGIAYISYNTYPGAHLRQIPRDLTRFHTRNIADPEARLREAYSIADFILAAMPEKSLERGLLSNVMAAYHASDALTLFDLLAEINEPCYFLDFMEQAIKNGLQFVAESDIRFMRTDHLHENSRKWLDTLNDRLLREQYLDFIHTRAFRKTILCRAGLNVNFAATPKRMERLSVACQVAATGQLDDVNGDDEVEFCTASGHEIVCKDAVPKAAYLELGKAFPRALGYAQLRERVGLRIGCKGKLDPELEAKLVQVLTSSHANGLAQFYACQFPFCTEVSEKPIASALARIQAETEDHVSSMCLASFALKDPFTRALLPLLDGTRNRHQIATDLKTVLGPEDAQKINDELLEAHLKTLADCAMLIG